MTDTARGITAAILIAAVIVVPVALILNQVMSAYRMCGYVG